MKRQEERINYLLREMRERDVVFSYLKKDGTTRVAVGTLRLDVLPPLKGGGRKPTPNLINYWDVDECAWRSFRRDNLLAVDWFDKITE